ncbi:F-box protein At3g07870 [Linum perenne]
MMGKKTETVSNMIVSLPGEILMDIISRLPVSSLLQIKLVCRAWRCLLQDPQLPYLHFSRLTDIPSHDHQSLILHSRSSINNEIYFLDLPTLNKDDDDEGALPELRKLAVPATNFRFILLGSCRGMMCLANESHRVAIYLYNPLLAEMKEIPTPKCGPNYSLGFGFHPGILYSQIKASFRFRTQTSPGSVISVLTLAAGKATEPSTTEPITWRRVGLVPYHFVNQTHQVPVLGRLHWAARRKERISRKHVLIMSFDLSDETIGEVSMPPVCRCERNCHCRFELLVVRSCLGIAEYKTGGEIKIWVMKDYGVKESWVNEITIDGVDRLGRELGLDTAQTTSFVNMHGVRRSGTYFHMISDFRVLWVMMNGEVLLEFKRCALVRFDPRDGSLKIVLREGGEFLVDSFDTIVHESSVCGIDASINM